MEQQLKPNILVIEDDLDMQEVLSELLSPYYSISCASDGVSGLKMAMRSPPDLILMDVRMPKMDGFLTCQAIRSDPEFDNIPILILSGFGGENERARALEYGADDFISKPFSNKELIARIKRRIEVSSKARRAGSEGGLSFGSLRLDLIYSKAYLENREIHFSQIEFRLLQLLVEASGDLVTRELLLEKVWNSQAPSSRVIDPHIVSIRDKLNGSEVSVSSVYGKGYRVQLKN